MFRRQGYWVAALIALAGIIPRVYFWSHSRPLWVDEEMVLLNVRYRTLAELAGPLWMGQSAPLGWLWLQRVVLLGFGTADRTGRAVPVLFGIATLLVAFLAGRRWLSPVGAAVFVALFAIGQHVTYFIFEAKQYSADVFWALLISALAIRAIDTHRTSLWWLMAAVAQWFGSGGLFVTPGCALVLLGTTWRRAGAKRAGFFALQGLGWLAAFAWHYQLSMRYTLHSEYLQSYWAQAFPPAPGGVSAAFTWLIQQVKPLALNPGGTTWPFTFWLVAICGIAIAIFSNAPRGLVLLSAPVSAFVFAAIRLVPLSGRLSLWIMPALFAGIAVTVDTAIEVGREAVALRNWGRAVPAAAAAVLALGLCSNIYQLGKADMFSQPQSKHGFDDHAAIRFLLSQRQPGDVFITTHLALPAVWWYADANPASRRSDIFEAWHEQQQTVCRSNPLKAALAGAPRVAVYFGFDSGNPPGLQELMLDRLSELGTMTTYRGIAEEGRAAIFDLRLPPKPWAVMATRPTGNVIEVTARPPGCIGARIASLW